MTDKVKAKIQELLPDMDWQKAERTDGMWEETITLAVVLRAIQKGAKYPNLVEYWLGEIQGEFIIKNDDAKSVVWNLEHDNYDQQSEQCKQFIGSLLLANQ